MPADELNCQFHSGERGVVFKKKAKPKDPCERLKSEATLAADHNMIIQVAKAKKVTEKLLKVGKQAGRRNNA